MVKWSTKEVISSILKETLLTRKTIKYLISTLYLKMASFQKFSPSANLILELSLVISR